MATMPTRERTFGLAFPSIVRQVDKLYLYLDGFSAVPAIVAGNPKVVAVLSSEAPGLHANGKLLGLTMEKRPCLYVCVDDDIYYRRHFVARLRSALASHGDRAVVGFHGQIWPRPFIRYHSEKTVFAYTDRLPRPREVDILGTGAVMFPSAALSFDVRNWPRGNMCDLGLAIEAARAGLPLISVTRRHREILTIEENQPDSLTRARAHDDTMQTALAREILRIRAGLPG
jgi:hypothetical protein